MKIKMKAFPVVFFTVACKKHDCHVGVIQKESKDRADKLIIGSQITALECQVGGPARTSRCVDDWELTISSTGSLTIE